MANFLVIRSESLPDLSLDELAAMLADTNEQATQQDDLLTASKTRLKIEYAMTMGALFSEARKRFKSNQEFGDWIAVTAKFQFCGNADTIRRWRKLYEAFGEYGPDVVELYGLSNCYELSAMDKKIRADLLDGGVTQKELTHTIAEHKRLIIEKNREEEKRRKEKARKDRESERRKTESEATRKRREEWKEQIKKKQEEHNSAEAQERIRQSLEAAARAKQEAKTLKHVKSTLEYKDLLTKDEWKAILKLTQNGDVLAHSAVVNKLKKYVAA